MKDKLLELLEVGESATEEQFCQRAAYHHLGCNDAAVMSVIAELVNEGSLVKEGKLYKRIK